MRPSDYQALLNEIVSSPREFDLKSLYESFYRSPLADVHYAVSEPKYAMEFRTIILNMVKNAISQ